MSWFWHKKKAKIPNENVDTRQEKQVRIFNENVDTRQEKQVPSPDLATISLLEICQKTTSELFQIYEVLMERNLPYEAKKKVDDLLTSERVNGWRIEDALTLLRKGEKP